MKVQDMVNNRYASDPVSQQELEKIHRELVYRHIAWLSALRHGMRQKKKWEVSHLSHTNREWHRIAESFAETRCSPFRKLLRIGQHRSIH